MKRSLLLMAIVLSVLVLSDHWLRQGQLDELDRHGVLRPLLAVDPEMVPDRVHQMVLSLGTGQTFTYVREGELWRFPEYHNALAHSDRIEGLLRLSLGSVGTFRSIVQGGEIAEPPQLSMQVDLYDRGKQILTKLQFAGPISGAGGSHNLARVVGSDSVLTLHANPIRVVGRGRPPLLDPHLLPRSLPRGTLTRVEMESEQGSWSLQRVLAPRTAGGPPMPMEESQRYRWVAHHGGRVDTCHSSSVFAYLDFLNRLPVDELTTTDLPTHAAEHGRHLMNAIRGLSKPQVREVRGLGLMIGIELKQPAGKVVRSLMDEGILALLAGPKVIRLLPPLIIEASDIDQIANAFDKVLT